MIKQSNGKQLLEVVDELRLTRSLDFLALLDRLSDKYIKGDGATLRDIPPKLILDESCEDMSEVSMIIKTKTVLAGRDVNPHNVVDAFRNPAGPSNAIRIVNDPELGECFELTQRFPERDFSRARWDRIVEKIPAWKRKES